MRALLAAALVAAIAPAGAAERPNIVVLSLDSLRTDRMALYAEDGTSMPALEALAERGAVFDRCRAVTPWTAPSVVSIFTGLQPLSHGVLARDDAPAAAAPSLPRLAAGAGYQIGNFAFFSGLSYFSNLGWGDPIEGLEHGRPVARFVSWLDEIDAERPFAAWVHLLEPHLPYGAPGYQARELSIPGSSGLEASQLHGELPYGSASFASGDRNKLLELYDRDLVAADLVIGELISALEAASILDETIIVVVADHGEELLDHGWVGHASTAEYARLSDELLDIPLIIVGPGLRPGQRSSALVQQTDILPTLVRLAGLPKAKPSDGKPLIDRRGRVRQRVHERQYFSSTEAGNLTPQHQRARLIFGAQEGDCRVAKTLGGLEIEGELSRLPAGQCTGPRGEKLLRQLDRFIERQAKRRLRLVGSERPPLPPIAELDAFADELQVMPISGTVLRWSDTDGQIAIDVDGGEGAEELWIAYEAGGGLRSTSGAFKIPIEGVVFGPFPPGFWNDIAAWSPFRFRAIDLELKRRSGWSSLELEKHRP